MIRATSNTIKFPSSWTEHEHGLFDELAGYYEYLGKYNRTRAETLAYVELTKEKRQKAGDDFQLSIQKF